MITLVLAPLFALAGYQEAKRFHQQYGRTPWGWDPWVWAVALGLSFLVGVVLLAVAERQGRSAAAKSARRGMPVERQVPALVGAGADVASEARWAPDPSGRHHYRWWDGSAWTTSVHTDGVTSTDG